MSATGEVYRAAEAAVVWLGNAANDSDEVFRLYEKYEKLLSVPMGIHRIPETKFTGRFRLAAARLSARPWFSRVWIIQEFAVSNLVLFKCGDKAVKIAGFDQLLRMGEERYFPQSPRLEPDFMTRVKQIATYSALWQTRRTAQQKHKPHEQASYSPASQNLLMHLFSENSDVNPKRLELLHLLAKYRLFGVTDPKDKVYALYCLARIESKPIAGSPLKTDYNLPTEIVFQKAAFQIITMTKNIDIFSFLLPRSRPPGIEQLRLPSWAPDWRLYDPNSVPTGLLWQRIISLIDIEHPIVLKLAGYPFDEIVSITPVLPIRVGSSNEDFFHVLCTWDDLTFSTTNYPTHEDIGHVYRSLILYGGHPNLKFWGHDPSEYPEAFACRWLCAVCCAACGWRILESIVSEVAVHGLMYGEAWNDSRCVEMAFV